MIKTNGRGSLIVVSGPSGAGKDSIINKLKEMNNNVWVSISCTSRDKRGREQDGVDYFFLSEQEFRDKIARDEFLEYAEYNNHLYGTPKDKIKEQLDKGIDVILEIEVQGALIIKNKIKDAIFVFIMPPSMKELRRRLIARKTETIEKANARFKAAYNEINEVNKYNYVIVNDEVDRAALKLNAILTAIKCRVDRIEDVYIENMEELVHEELINKEFENEDIKL